MTADTFMHAPAKAELWPSPARAWWMMVVFFVIAILSYSDRLVLGLLVDPLRADLHISDTEVSLLQGLAFALIYAVAGIPLGRFADLLPRRNVIVAGIVIWSAATIVCGYAQSFTVLFIARLCVGIGEAALAPAAVSMIADSFPPHRRGMAVGFLLTGMSIGGGAALAIGGFLLQAADQGLFSGLPLIGTLAPWRVSLVLLGLAGTIGLVLLLTVREPRRQAREAGDSAPLPIRTVLRTFIAHAPLLLPIYLAVAFVSAGEFSFHNWTPTLLTRRFGWSPAETGAALGAISIATGVFGTLFGGWLSDRLMKNGGERARLKVAIATTTVGLVGAGIALATTGNMVLAFFTLWMLTASMGETIGITVLQDLVPGTMRGVGTSLVSFCNMLIGLALGTMLTAVVTDHVYRDPLAVGLSITTVTLPADLLALGLFCFAVRRLRRRP